MRFKGINILKQQQQKRIPKEEMLKLIIFGENENNNYQLEFGTFQLGSKSKKTKQMIENMKQTAAFYGANSIAANQLCQTNSVFLMARNKMRKQEQWIHDDLNPGDYDVFINPVIHQISELQEYGWEYCISFPNLRAKVLRHSEIRVSYFDENFKEQQELLTDFEARVFQHEYDHLQGLTMINMEVSNGNLERLEDENDTPQFNKVFKEFQKFIETRMQQENKELNESKKQSRYFKEQRDDEGDLYWDPTEQVKSKYDELEFQFQDRMEKAIQSDRANNKSKNPNLF